MQIMTNIYNENATCISCGSSNLEELYSFGSIPLADRLLNNPEELFLEIKVPLTLCLCKNCSLCQIKEIVNPNLLFGAHYPYYTSISPQLINYYKESAKEIISKYQLNSNNKVLEIASNDGTFLNFFNEEGMFCLGVDPSEGPVKIAQSNGINTVLDFFNENLSHTIINKYGLFDIIIANNVLAHVNDLTSVVKGVKGLLDTNGRAIFEVPYLLDMINKTEFDTIFHQHICYFSLTSLQNLFHQYQLYVNDVQRTSNHGGSLRFTVSHFNYSSSSVTELLEYETHLSINNHSFYESFINNISHVKVELLNLLDRLKKDGKKIVGYGAAGKANTLLNFIGIDSNYIDFIADLSTYKQGKYFTGNGLKIVSPQEMLDYKPDYILILAWNFANEIIHQLKSHSEMGGKFIVPIPETKII